MKSKGSVFLLDDDDLITSMISRALKKEGYEVTVKNEVGNAVKDIVALDPDILILDITMPEKSGMEILKEIIDENINVQVVMLTADDTAESAVKAMKLGAVDYITKPFSTDEVKIIINSIMENKKLKHEVNFLRKAYSEVIQKDFIGESTVIKEAKAKVEKMAEAGVAAILVTGESGTGKEVLARHIHHLMFSSKSSRQAPFISINCAAIPETLLESELFGYEKGAFTGAKTNKKGLLEEAKGGTILLDEIGDMQLALQSKLLRVLEERIIRRVGGKREIPVDTTVIATSNVNLVDAVGKGEFRKDLFFRLSPFYLHLPPLRERESDILILSRYFFSYFKSKYNKKEVKYFSSEAEKLLLAYNWPGNIRELKNLIERIVVLEINEVITPENLPEWIAGGTKFSKPSSVDAFILPESGISLETLEKDLIIQALGRTENNMVQAAKLLDMTYDSFRYQLKKFKLK